MRPVSNCDSLGGAGISSSHLYLANLSGAPLIPALVEMTKVAKSRTRYVSLKDCVCAGNQSGEPFSAVCFLGAVLASSNFGISEPEASSVVPLLSADPRACFVRFP